MQHIQTRPSVLDCSYDDGDYDYDYSRQGDEGGATSGKPVNHGRGIDRLDLSTIKSILNDFSMLHTSAKVYRKMVINQDTACMFACYDNQSGFYSIQSSAYSIP